MRVAIAGAGGVGRSIAAELSGSGHEVLLIDRDTRAIGVDELPRVEWLLADACELASLEDARLSDFDAVVAASGDDKVNLVVSLLAKTEFGVGRVIARINDPRNEWLFTESWGVDMAVSPPRLIAALVDAPDTDVEDELAAEASGGVSLPETDLLEFTLPDDTPHDGRLVAEFTAVLPEGVVLVAVVRAGRAHPPEAAMPLRGGDGLVFLGSADAVEELGVLLAPEPG
ncbi:potassium channel family protein [Streptomonospora nanhaiensis]|uniref:Trk system potassium uptake protein TrkA n=1 Tax=Streptomonospora nanhaiensis TaxID=1323731 RepID=A0A853BH28_9ACTN|nr:TrkA family potassium uptake protein [Streptomonospora nanhaiensis]MBV2366598.1 TrkA family potassium uptake protein [Streptomonospora nanhaiensis]MBX9388601.1 TrkA family potassium uptake protein [Streptomonospora nanhaiensis]NYI93847.1 trk system potassium uptake protein TrkA [Streptomonospora nanhaiensis]